MPFILPASIRIHSALAGNLTVPLGINSALVGKLSAPPGIKAVLSGKPSASSGIKSALVGKPSAPSGINSASLVAYPHPTGQATNILTSKSIYLSSMLKTQSIDQLLSQAQVAIDNALNNPTILSALSDYAYTTARIQTGKKLYSEAAAAQIAQTAEAGEQISASATVNDAWETAKKSYIRLIKIARIAFKGNAGISTQLALGGARKRTLAGWMAEAMQFYQNAIANKVILSGFKEFGITEQKLQAGLAELAVVEAANLTQEKEKGEAQAATQKRDVALDDLQDWLSDFLAIARIALEEDPQLLEGLGVLARS